MIDISISLQELEYFFLIVVRTTGFIFAAPFFSLSTESRIQKIGLSIMISYLLYFVLQPRPDIAYSTLLGYSVIVMKEMLVGLLIGYSTNICTYIIAFAGNIIDMEIGLSMVSQMDPATKQTATFSGIFYQYAITLMMLVTGMYQYFIKAYAEVYILIPVNGAIFHGQKLLEAMLVFLREFVMIGFQIALPVFIVMMLLNAILGVLAKVAPQMNMFTVGIQLKILLGLSLLMVMTGMLPVISDFIFNQMKRMLVLFVEGMR